MSGLIGQGGFNKSGIIGPRLPNNICFKVTGGATSGVNYNSVIFATNTTNWSNSIKWNIGSAFNTTTGKFAPSQDGIYAFDMNIRLQNTTVTNYHHVGFFHRDADGTSLDRGADEHTAGMIQDVNHADAYTSFSGSVLFEILGQSNPGEYVSIQYYNTYSSGTQYIHGESYFCGHFVQ